MHHPTPPASARARDASTEQLDHLTRFMSGLHHDQEQLRVIQSEYDNLTLLGQLLGAGTDITDISGMRADFGELASDLLRQLAVELHRKAIRRLRSNARVAIDVLVRNLFERTADIGFLATDAEVRACAEAHGRAKAHADAGAEFAHAAEVLGQRFAEYVRKYSVYHDIILLAPDGTVLVKLDPDAQEGRVSRDPLIKDALHSQQPYVEIFRDTDLLPGQPSPLIYAYRVMAADGSKPVGVLCLCFRFEDECSRIFRGLLDEDDWTVITILDGEGRVIASSDIYQFPPGARLARVDDGGCRVVRFGGREYLATTQSTHGYQGYMGPGWSGHALAPLNHAFEMAVAHEVDRVPSDVLETVLRGAKLFSPTLRDIPARAMRIQKNLNRAVWNGSAWLSRADGDAPATAKLNTGFAKVLLREIGNTGSRTSDVFSHSTDNLYRTVLSAVLADCSLQAALAMDIMDRNLYERANDCRWWALTGAFRDTLGASVPPGPQACEELSRVLRGINSLYTVYSNLLIFDTNATVLAVSNPAYSDWRGRTLHADWVRQTLTLTDTQSYCVSAFEPTPLYDGAATYIYAAAVRDPLRPERVVGGVAIVFDAAPQFQTMLHDALPRHEHGGVVDGAFAVFAERDGRVIASTDAELAPGMTLDIDPQFLKLAPGDTLSNIVTLRGRHYAVGSRVSAGYREYKSADDRYRNEVVALVLVPVSESLQPAVAYPAPAAVHKLQAARLDEASFPVATFRIGESWFGLRADLELEAVEHQPLSALPGMPRWTRGCLMLRGEPVTVLDAQVLLPEHRDTPTLKQATQPAQIVVLRQRGSSLRLALEVDELGEVTDIASERVEPLPDLSGDGTMLARAVIRPAAGDSPGRVLALLSPERLFQRIDGAAAAPSMHDAAAHAPTRLASVA